MFSNQPTANSILFYYSKIQLKKKRIQPHILLCGQFANWPPIWFGELSSSMYYYTHESDAHILLLYILYKIKNLIFILAFFYHLHTYDSYEFHMY